LSKEKIEEIILKVQNFELNGSSDSPVPSTNSTSTSDPLSFLNSDPHPAKSPQFRQSRSTPDLKFKSKKDRFQPSIHSSSKSNHLDDDSTSESDSVGIRSPASSNVTSSNNRIWGWNCFSNSQLGLNRQNRSEKDENLTSVDEKSRKRNLKNVDQVEKLIKEKVEELRRLGREFFLVPHTSNPESFF